VDFFDEVPPKVAQLVEQFRRVLVFPVVVGLLELHERISRAGALWNVILESAADAKNIEGKEALQVLCATGASLAEAALLAVNDAHIEQQVIRDHGRNIIKVKGDGACVRHT
jgi:hypothetical protein